MVFMEDCSIYQISDILFVALGEEKESLRIPLRSFPKAFSVRILANTFEDSLHRSRQFLNPFFGLFRGRFQSGPSART